MTTLDEIPRVAPRHDIARITLGVTFLVGMIAGTLWIMRPFLGGMIWGATIAVATWPLMLRLEGWLGGRRALTVTVMTVVMLLIFVVPIAVSVAVVVVNVDEIVAWGNALATMTIPPPPAWVERLPLVGSTIGHQWREIAARPSAIATTLAPYARTLAGWLVGFLGSIALLFVELMLITAIAA